jgi:hypothetical protein
MTSNSYTHSSFFTNPLHIRQPDCPNRSTGVIDPPPALVLSLVDCLNGNYALRNVYDVVQRRTCGSMAVDETAAKQSTAGSAEAESPTGLSLNTMA